MHHEDQTVFISYAQNFEDLMLWRVFRDSPPGCYVDVGANDPTDTSVTRAFYERGWRGVNIEPVEYYYNALCERRNEDINLEVAISDKEGELEFFEMPYTGLSTGDPDLVEYYRKQGKEFVKRTVPTTTLTKVFEEYVHQEVQFLKIDVEGLEAEVLAGMDFSRWRPWVLVIESPFDKEPVWKRQVLEAGYEYVHFDGLNGFYLATEHLRFKGAFDLPPCSMDYFQLCYGHRLSYPVDEIASKLEEAIFRAECAEDRLEKLYNSRTFRFLSRIRQALSFG